jgi:putative transcriptional regulator
MQNRLREMREKLGLTQEEVAAHAGVSRQTIISIEKGKYNPSITLAYRLSKLFNMSIEELFLLDERSNENDQK